MHITRVITNSAYRISIHPFQVKECSCSSIKHYIMPPEVTMFTNLTTKGLPMYINRCDIFVA